MSDIEPHSSRGEFYHTTTDPKGKKHWCPNAGKTFTLPDDTKEIEPFMRKGERRKNARLGLRDTERK
jgi:hypothetical protein